MRGGVAALRVVVAVARADIVAVLNLRRRRDCWLAIAKLRYFICQFERVGLPVRIVQRDSFALERVLSNFNFIAVDFNLASIDARQCEQLINGLRGVTDFIRGNDCARRSCALIFFAVKAVATRAERQTADCEGFIADRDCDIVAALSKRRAAVEGDFAA